MKRAMAVALLAFVAAACGSGDGTDEAAAAEPQTDEEAVDVCRQSVEGKLRAPATAEFSGEATEAKNGHGDWFEVTGDAENGFGALLRMTWTCDARQLSDGSWSVESQVRD